MKLRLSFIVLIISAIFSASFAQSTNSGQEIETIAVVNVNVVPMDRERILPNQTVIIRNGLISEIGKTGKIKIPAGTVKIDGRGKYLIPGLVDAHVHLNSTIEMPLYIANGVTTVFDLNGRLAHLSWKQKIASGKLFGPTIYACGPRFNQIRKPEEDIKEVERQFAAGYDGVKIYVVLSKEEYPSIVATAKSHNMIVVGHIPRLPGFEATVKTGQSIAHAEEYLYTFFNQASDPYDNNIKLDESRIPEAVALTRSGGGAVIPTLVAYNSIVEQLADLDGFLKNPEFKYLPPPHWDILQPALNRYKNDSYQPKVSELRDNLEFQKKLVKSLHDAGVPIIAGTDSMGVGPIAGFSLHRELQNFVSLGLSPFESLRTATVDAAEFLKGGDKFGTITVGKRADLLLIDGNPLKDIRNTTRIDGVMLQGKWLPQAKLHQMLESLPNNYKQEVQTVTKTLQQDSAAALLYLNDNDPFGQMSGEIIRNILFQEGFQQLKSLLQQVKQNNSSSILTRENTLNTVAFKLLRTKKVKEAMEIFQMNVDFYPKSANVYDSIAEAYLVSGDKELAIKNYKKSLELNPQNINALDKLKSLQP